ncbi:unnamed protein product [Calypogeia fissa]
MIPPDSPPNVPPSSLYLAKCVLRSSVVLQAAYGHFRSPSSLDLVFGKESALELAVVSEVGVVESVCEQPVFGSIKDLRVLPWNEDFRGAQPELHGKDLLVLLSDSGKLSFLTFSMDLHRFLGVSHTHLCSPGSTGKDVGRLLAVEPRGRAVAVGGYEDRIAVFPTSIAAGNNVVEKRMIFPGPTMVYSANEASLNGVRGRRGGNGTIWSMAFLETPQEYPARKDAALILVVLMYRSGGKACDILVLNCDVGERIIHVLATYDPGLEIPGHLALNIIEFPVLPGYLLLSRAGDLLLLDLRNPNAPRASTIVCEQQQSFAEKAYVLDDGEGPDTLAASALLELFSRGGDSPEKRSICAWSWQPDNGELPRLVLGMDTGEVVIAHISIENSEVFQIEIRESLYRCSPCKSLLWMEGGFIAALVEMGDGQILEVVDGGLSFRSLIQNIAPIVDFTLVDYHEEKQDQMFACCGIGQEGSIRVVRSGISVDRLLSTPPMYQGVTGTWTLRMFQTEEFHLFFVMSFVEETRVLSVGLNFVDITDFVGFESSASTLTCGLIEDGWVAQVCSKEVLLCAPTQNAHPRGISGPSPLRVSWKPQEAYISLGAVSKGTIILALARPGVLMILGTRFTDAHVFEVVEIQRCQLGAEISCISIPCEEGLVFVPGTPCSVGSVEEDISSLQLCGIEIGKVCVVGTHKPSVELLSIVHGEDFKPLAVGLVSLVNSFGTVMGGCVPENVRLALFDRLYILCGLRNGMLLRYEWPSVDTCTSTSPLSVSLKATDTPIPSVSESSFKAVDIEKQRQTMHIDDGDVVVTNGVEVISHVNLHLVDVRRIGISPVSFIPLQPSLRADIVALSDRPWLLQTSRNSHRMAYRSISFQPSTHGTPVRSPECPNGVLFVADCSLHLVEMEHSKRLNVQRLPLGRSPRHVLYHSDSKMLLVMRSDRAGSDICCVDPLAGSIHSCFQLDEGEIGRCMQLWYQRGEHLLLVGTGLTDGKPIMPNGEPECSKGRLLIFRIQSRFVHGKSRSCSDPVHGVSAVGNIPLGGEHEFSSLSTCTPMVIGESTVIDDISQDELKITDNESWELSMVSQIGSNGMILAVSPYSEQYVLASAGNNLLCLGFTHDSNQRLRRFASIKTRFVITSIAVHLGRIAVGDCRDGVLFYCYREDKKVFEHLHSDPVQRLVADCVLVDLDTAAVTDRHGNFSVLSSANIAEGIESISPERNLATSCWYHMGETIMRIAKGSFAHRAPAEETMKVCNVGSSSKADLLNGSLVASTLLGSVFIFIQVTREEYELLEALQKRLAVHPLTAPLLGHNHYQYRQQGCPAGVCQVLDGDMLGQFLDLTNSQQQMILAGENAKDSIQSGMLRALGKNFPLEQVLGLFERIHNYLT